MLTQADREFFKNQRRNMTKASDMQTDSQASLTPELHPIWMKSDWEGLKLGSKRNYDGKTWRFNQPALANESQNMEPGSVGSESLWTWLNYRDGYRIIPNPITVTSLFSAGERGWWTDGKLYESKVDNNTYTPAQYAANWILISVEEPIEPEEPVEPEPVEWPDWKPWDGNNDNLYQVGAKVTHKGSHWIGNIPNNHYEPGVYGWTKQV